MAGLFPRLRAPKPAGKTFESFYFFKIITKGKIYNGFHCCRC